jgi:hypothetical protein
LGLQLHKLLPLVLLTTSTTTPFEKNNAHPLSFSRHYGWILLAGLLSNLCLAGFLASYLVDLRDVDEWQIPAAMMGSAVLESIVLAHYYATMCTTARCVTTRKRLWHRHDDDLERPPPPSRPFQDAEQSRQQYCRPHGHHLQFGPCFYTAPSAIGSFAG